jgi:hypothetical protein
MQHVCPGRKCAGPPLLGSHGLARVGGQLPDIADTDDKKAMTRGHGCGPYEKRGNALSLNETILMKIEGNIWAFLGVGAIVVVLRIIADRLDRQRIREEIEENGGKIVEIHWDPFGPGWFGEKSDRIYEVTYQSKKGHRVVAHCKTSMWSGVYWRDRQESKDTRVEDMNCLSCGHPMHKRKVCPECGWTYEEK